MGNTLSFTGRVDEDYYNENKELREILIAKQRYIQNLEDTIEGMKKDKERHERGED